MFRSKIIAFFVAVFLVSGLPAYASDRLITVHVSGMVCDFCARSLEKVFKGHEAAEGVSVNLDAKTVELRLNEGKSIDDATIGTLVKDSGYNVVEIVRARDEQQL